MVTPTESSTKSTSISWKESNPGIGRVDLAGSFSSWTPVPMTRSSCGTWIISVDIPSGRHEYKVIVDGEWRVDESAPRVFNDMGTENNVIEVPLQEEGDVVMHHEEGDAMMHQKEKNDATFSSRVLLVDLQVEANTKMKMKWLHHSKLTANSVGFIPNPTIEHLTQDFDHLLKVENGEENPLLMSLLTRGKLKKFTAQIGGNAGSKTSGVTGSKTSGTAGTKPGGSSRNASSKVLGSASNCGTKQSVISRNAASKPIANIGSNAGSRPIGGIGSVGSKSSGMASAGSKAPGISGSKASGISGYKPLRITGYKPLGNAGDSAPKPSETKVNPRSASNRVQASKGSTMSNARAQPPKTSSVIKDRSMANDGSVSKEKLQPRKGSISGSRPQFLKASSMTCEKSRPASKSVISEKQRQPVKHSGSNAENQIPNAQASARPPVFARGRRGGHA